MKGQFLIVLLAFSIPNSFCRHFLEAGESLVELGIFQKVLYDYDIYWGGDNSCRHMVAEAPHDKYVVRPFIKNYVCNGKYIRCAWLDKTTACASTVGRQKIRWLRSVLDGKTSTYGTPDTCSPSEGVATYSTQEGRSVCYCDCAHNNWGVHLGLMQSRKADNYVIIGMRFIVHDNVLYLQPAEGQLNGFLEVTDISWVPLPTGRRKIHTVDHDSANFFLDDLKLDSNYVLTGIQFIYMEAENPKKVKGFGIRVSGQPYARNGQLNLGPGTTLTIQPAPQDDRYESSDNTPINKIGEPLSARSIVNHQYVKLHLSDISDFGQTTVPLFHNPLINEAYQKPLSGFGVFLESIRSGEKFLSLRFHELIILS